MSRYISIGDMAKRLGVSISTLRRWDEEGRGPKSIRTRGGQRRYEVVGAKDAPSKRVTIAYARVSSHDQKEDLKRQQKVLEMYCAAKGWTFDLISDLGSGMNYRKKGLKQLLLLFLNPKIPLLTDRSFYCSFKFALKKICRKNWFSYSLYTPYSEHVLA